MIKEIFKLRTICAFAVIFLFIFAANCRRSETDFVPFSKVRTIYSQSEKFGEPFGIAYKNGVLFVSDGENGKIWQSADLQNFAILTDNLETPSAIVFDKNGDLIVADSGSHTIKKIKIENGATEIIAGAENTKGFADGEAKSALFNAPIGVAVSDNKIFVADTYNDKIRVIENGQVSTLAGSEKGFVDGIANEAKFDTPAGIALTKDGNLIVADTGNRRLRLIEQNARVSTIAGNGKTDSIDGYPLQAAFIEPIAVTIDDSGIIYVADGNSIRAIGRRFFPFVETLSHSKRGFSDGELRQSKFNRPSGLAADKKGNLFVADADNQVIRVLTGAEIGKEITNEEIRNLRFTPEEFRALGEPRWTYDPPDRKREIAATFGEIRGEIKDENSDAWFHNGLDISGGYGEKARFIRPEKVLLPIAVQNFATSRELIRMPTMGYVHIRLGRDKDEKTFNDARFQFAFDEAGKPKALRVARGAKFDAGEAIGTLNRMNHVHLISGRSGAEMNALDALIFPGISDSIAPIIEKIMLFDENWNAFETEKINSRITLSGRIRVVVQAFDQMEGNVKSRKLGVYRLGYQILQADKTPITEINQTISFDRLPDANALNFVYAVGSKSGYTPQTVFNYIVTNEVKGEAAHESFFDTKKFENGNYILRVFAADFFGNQTSKDVEITIEN